MNKKILALAIVSCFVSCAHSESVIYKYRNAKGQIVYSDNIPSNEKGEIQILSGKTMALKKITEKQLNSQEIIEKNVAEKTQKDILETSEVDRQKDQALLSTYSSLDDIEKVKQYELQQINRAIQNDSDVLSTLKSKKDEIDSKSKDATGNPLPKAAQEAKDIQQNIDNISGNLAKNKTLYESRDKKYNDDKARYASILQKMAQDPSKK